ncbi:hypothetical protein BC938DRAFT_482574 [Jimgerdemannia flammicorona]|uniref:Uncharacterized protein n=1 Tax=Jimgerdemannia flammicorona TaxID=994334 RepID=A0A433QDT8_9FUNG|nr:hypothetical protein BC938DRAFT_482574 [Jimgerdemannia flammicorona]
MPCNEVDAVFKPTTTSQRSSHPLSSPPTTPSRLPHPPPQSPSQTNQSTSSPPAQSIHSAPSPPHLTATTRNRSPPAILSELDTTITGRSYTRRASAANARLPILLTTLASAPEIRSAPRRTCVASGRKVAKAASVITWT